MMAEEIRLAGCVANRFSAVHVDVQELNSRPAKYRCRYCGAKPPEMPKAIMRERAAGARLAKKRGTWQEKRSAIFDGPPTAKRTILQHLEHIIHSYPQGLRPEAEWWRPGFSLRDIDLYVTDGLTEWIGSAGDRRARELAEEGIIESRLVRKGRFVTVEYRWREE